MMHMVRDKKFPEASYCTVKRPEVWTVALEKCECFPCLMAFAIEQETKLLRTARALEYMSIALGKYKRDMDRIVAEQDQGPDHMAGIAMYALTEHGLMS